MNFGTVVWFCSDSRGSAAGEFAAVEGEEASQDVCTVGREVRSDLLHKNRRLHCDCSEHRRGRQRGMNYGCFPANFCLLILTLLCSCLDSFKAMVTRHASMSSRKLSKALTILTSDKCMVAMSDYNDFHKMVKKYILANVLGANAQVVSPFFFS